jgi:sigma-B regulation protein RsbU (phosphoserine phosphatase)
MDDWLNHAPCGYLRLSPQSQILYANQTLVRWLGLPPDDLPGRPVADILTVSSRIFYLGNILPLLQQGNAAQEAYLELISPDQTRLPMLLNAHPSRTDDGIVYEIALLPMMRRNLLEEK